MKSYSSDIYGVTKSDDLGLLASNGAADTAQQFWSPPVKSVISNILGVVKVAGTATTAGFRIYQGTTSIGVLLCGTDAAATRESAGLAATTFASTDVLKVTNLTSDASLSVSVEVIWQEQFAVA